MTVLKENMNTDIRVTVLLSTVLIQNTQHIHLLTSDIKEIQSESQKMIKKNA